MLIKLAASYAARKALTVKCLCVCRWTEPVASRTKLDPVDGGGYGPGGPEASYSWTQNATEVCVMFKVRHSTAPYYGYDSSRCGPCA